MLVMCKGLDRKQNTVVVEGEEEETEEGAFSVTMIVSGLGVTMLVTTWGGAGAEVGACEVAGCVCEVGAAGVDEGCEPPAVPDGLPAIWMYMYRLSCLLPHFSSGKPGQSTWQLLTSVWSAGM
jgi:hypothetical protein